MKRYFVTIFDHRYLPRGLAMYKSLMTHCNNFTLWVVALTPECFEELEMRSLPNLASVKLRDVEERLPKLLEAKGNRSLVEYYYTLSSASCKYFIDELPKGDILTYLDSDLFFFSSLERIFNLLGDSSVGITPHRLSFGYRHQKEGGDFNVGWLSFRNDSNGLSCLNWWYESCIDWCYARHEDGKYSDQGYLNWFPIKFDAVKVIDDPGVNLAPWNLPNHRVYKKSQLTLIDGVPLVFFHFAGFNQVSSFHYSTGTSTGMIWLTPTIRKRIFYPYIQTLRDVAPAGVPYVLKRKKLSYSNLSKKDIKKVPRFLIKKFRNILFFQYVFVIRKTYI